MCLTINKRIHPDIKPLNRDVDLLIYKYLAPFGGGSYVTPFLHQPVFFVDNIATLESNCKLTPFKAFYGESVDYECEKGIHGFIVKNIPFSWKRFRAIIPGGTEFFVGDDRDIVATKIIIFKTYFSYLKYCFRYGKPLKANKEYATKDLL